MATASSVSSAPNAPSSTRSVNPVSARVERPPNGSAASTRGMIRKRNVVSASAPATAAPMTIVSPMPSGRAGTPAASASVTRWKSTSMTIAVARYVTKSGRNATPKATAEAAASIENDRKPAARSSRVTRHVARRTSSSAHTRCANVSRNEAASQMKSAAASPVSVSVAMMSPRWERYARGPSVSCSHHVTPSAARNTPRITGLRRSPAARARAPSATTT